MTAEPTYEESPDWQTLPVGEVDAFCADEAVFVAGIDCASASALAGVWKRSAAEGRSFKDAGPHRCEEDTRVLGTVVVTCAKPQDRRFMFVAPAPAPIAEIQR